MLRRPATATNPQFPLLAKYNAANFTVEGLEAKDAEKPVIGGIDPESTIDDKDIPADSPAGEPPAIEVTINKDLFTYDETHKVLKDGRIVEIDPVTGKWSRRLAGIAKDLWERLPHLQKELPLLGPELFTDEELREGSDPVTLPSEPVVISDDAGAGGLADLDTYDDCPTDAVEDDVAPPEPSSSSGRDVAHRADDSSGWRPFEQDHIWPG